MSHSQSNTPDILHKTSPHPAPSPPSAASYLPYTQEYYPQQPPPPSSQYQPQAYSPHHSQSQTQTNSPSRIQHPRRPSISARTTSSDSSHSKYSLTLTPKTNSALDIITDTSGIPHQQQQQQGYSTSPSAWERETDKFLSASRHHNHPSASASALGMDLNTYKMGDLELGPGNGIGGSVEREVTSGGPSRTSRAGSASSSVTKQPVPIIADLPSQFQPPLSSGSAHSQIGTSSLPLPPPHQQQQHHQQQKPYSQPPSSYPGSPVSRGQSPSFISTPTSASASAPVSASHSAPPPLQPSDLPIRSSVSSAHRSPVTNDQMPSMAGGDLTPGARPGQGQGPGSHTHPRPHSHSLPQLPALIQGDSASSISTGGSYSNSGLGGGSGQAISDSPLEERNVSPFGTGAQEGESYLDPNQASGLGMGTLPGTSPIAGAGAGTGAGVGVGVGVGSSGPGPTSVGTPSLVLQPAPSDQTNRASITPSETLSTLTRGGGGSVGVPGVGSETAERTAGNVPEGFDEGVLRALCDLDCALPLVTERIKQSIMSCKQVAAFFRARAELEEKYARSMMELVRTSADNYGRAYCKAGSFVEAYHASFRIHESLASNRLRSSQRLSETSEELLTLAKEGERLRKIHKETGARYERNVQDSDMVLDKAKSRFDSTAEELERILIAKEGESVKDVGGIASASKEKRGIGKAMKQGMLFKGKSSANIQRQEDDVRGRMNQASEVFKKAVTESQAVKQEYFNLQLPKVLRLLKESADEIDMGTQYHLTRYAFLYETTVAADGELISPNEGSGNPGLKTVFENIDNRNDFKSFMQNFAVARGSMRGPQRVGPYDENFVPSLPPHVQASQMAMNNPNRLESHYGTNGDSGSVYSNSHLLNSAANNSQSTPATSGLTYGVELGEQMVRDGTEVPKIVEKCVQAIEALGMDSVGIYRLSGTTSKVQRLKAALDKDIDHVDVMSEEFGSDINVVASALKLWFRELPEPLLTNDLYQRFIDAAGLENDRLRHIRTHEVVNELPDPNYACLKYFMGHLDQIRRRESQNSMSISNLAIVFGPTLLAGGASFNLEHTPLQSKTIETILEHYEDIFVEAE